MSPGIYVYFWPLPLSAVHSTRNAEAWTQSKTYSKQHLDQQVTMAVRPPGMAGHEKTALAALKTLQIPCTDFKDLATHVS